jgi:uncharacterized protein (DUF305 family)
MRISNFAAAVTLCMVPGLALAQATPKPSYAAVDMHQMLLNGAHGAMAMKPSADIDYDFVAMMRQLHKAGVQMAEQEMQHGKDPKAREFARRIAEGQQKQMQEFDEWLKSRGGPGKS